MMVSSSKKGTGEKYRTLCAPVFRGEQILVETRYCNQNLVRFAHNWNNGMLEYWNIGFIFRVVEK
jgi:hypothetical protein